MDTAITSCDAVRDLQILSDNQLKFHLHHTTTVSKKSNRLLTINHKAFQYFAHNTCINNLYKSYTRPALEYGNVFWGLHYILNQNNKQRRATKLIHDLQNCTYNDCLTTLNLPSLKYRRLTMFCQLLHNHLIYIHQTCLLLYQPQLQII